MRSLLCLFIVANLLYIESALCGIFYFKKVVKWCTRLLPWYNFIPSTPNLIRILLYPIYTSLYNILLTKAFVHLIKICLKNKCDGSIGNSLENLDSSERDLGVDFREWLEIVENWKRIVDRIVFHWDGCGFFQWVWRKEDNVHFKNLNIVLHF